MNDYNLNCHLANLTPGSQVGVNALTPEQKTKLESEGYVLTRNTIIEGYTIYRPVNVHHRFGKPS